MATRLSRRAFVSRRRGQSRKCCGRGRPATSTGEWPRRRVDLEMLRRAPEPNGGRPDITALNPHPPRTIDITANEARDDPSEAFSGPLVAPKGLALTPRQSVGLASSRRSCPACKGLRRQAVSKTPGLRR